MALRIMNNVSAVFAQRQLGINSHALQSSLAKLSSGYRINNAGDDAAGLAVSEKMRFQIKGMEQAGRNIQDGISLAQVAEGGLSTVGDILQRLRTLSVQAANGTLASSDRMLIQQEVNALVSEIDRMSSSVSFNGTKLLYTVGNSIQLQVGASNGQNLKIQLSSITITGLGISPTGGFNITTSSQATGAISTLDSALTSVLSLRAKIGAASNRLALTYDFNGIQRENMMAAESRIRDTDFAEEMTNYTRNQILMQASTAMLSQANVSIQSVLSLLQ